MTKERSARLQDRLFEQYTFKNINGVSKSLKHIFEATIFKTPAGAGECAALSFFNTHLIIINSNLYEILVGCITQNPKLET